MDWIRLITPGENYVAYTADPIFTTRVTADATVFLAHSDQGSPQPAWLSTYTNTGEQLVVTSGTANSNAPRFTPFTKRFHDERGEARLRGVVVPVMNISGFAVATRSGMADTLEQPCAR